MTRMHGVEVTRDGVDVRVVDDEGIGVGRLGGWEGVGSKRRVKKGNG